MALLLRMPSLSPTMETGVISNWTKKVGDYLDVGTVGAEIETDKAVMEFEMADEGYLREILLETGKEAPVGSLIAILTAEKDEDYASALADAQGGAPSPAPKTEAPSSASTAPSTAAAPQEAPATASPAAVQAVAKPAPANGAGAGRMRLSPYARKLAADKQLAPSALQGSGPGGRIVAKDVEAATSGGSAARAAPGATATPRRAAALAVAGESFEDLPVSMMRKTIARRLQQSKQTIPHFQLTRKVRAEGMRSARAVFKEVFPEVRVTVNDLLIKACAIALQQHPEVNSQFLEDKIRRFHNVDIAVAVATEDGLITPVVRNVKHKGLVAISEEVRSLADKAREKKLTQEDYQGGTFTISNLGMFGVTEFNAIINPPQACILAVSGVTTEPVVEDGQLAVGQTMNLTLSSDHRVVDGVVAARYMATLAKLVENPLGLLL